MQRLVDNTAGYNPNLGLYLAFCPGSSPPALCQLELAYPKATCSDMWWMTTSNFWQVFQCVLFWHEAVLARSGQPFGTPLVVCERRCLSLVELSRHTVEQR